MAARTYSSLNLTVESEAELGVEELHSGYLSNRSVFDPQTQGWEEDDPVPVPEKTSHLHYLRRLLRGD
jgi:hypothetical protein